MNAALLAQYVMNGLMLGMMYGLVAVGFTLFFGVLDVIKFSHGDVLTVGAFTALATFAGVNAIGLASPWLALLLMIVIATLAMAFLGMLIARFLVMPLRSAPALNTLLITLMLGTVLRECVRLFYPQGANPKPFPALLPRGSIDIGAFNLRFDNVMMLAAGALVHPAVARGIKYLAETQKPDGLWNERRYTATGFPRVFYLRYHGYAKYFPLWALARYRNLTRGNAQRVAWGM